MGNPASDAASEPKPAEIIRDGDHLSADDSVGQPAALLRGEGALTVRPGGILITTHLWITWLQVAIERARAARLVREEMMRLLAEGKQISQLLSSEFEASVVAIAGCAHALDALYGSEVVPESARRLAKERAGCPLENSSRSARIRPALKLAFGKGRLRCPNKDRSNRPGKIREALKLVFNTGKVNTPWVAQFEWLFDMRDSAVHAAEKPAPPELHPAAGHTSRENALYTVESAEQAVEFALSVFRWCVDHPRQKAPETVAWAANMHLMVEQLESQWLGTAA